MTDIRSVIHLPPDDTVRAFDARDALRITTRWDEMYHADHARAFTVAKVARLDLLDDIRNSIADVAHNGGTFEQWQANIVPDLQRAGWWGRVQDRSLTGTDDPVHVGPRRLRNIYDTNMRVSRAAGRWARIQELKDVAPFLVYNAVRDTRTRPLHRRWGGLDTGRPIVLPVDHRCWRIYYPPCGWGCRCDVLQMSARDLARRSLSVTTDAELIALGWLTADGKPGGDRRLFWRSGRETPEGIPGGVDPGFDYNPGEASFAAIAEQASRRLARLAEADEQAAIAELVDLATGARPIRIVHTLGAAGPESPPELAGFRRQLSTDEVRHMLLRHGAGGTANDRHPIDAADFRLIPAIIARGVRTDHGKGDQRSQALALEKDGLFYVYVERIGRKFRRLLGRTFFKADALPRKYRGGEG